MSIEVVCSACNRRLRVPDKAAGKRIKCPQCQGVVSVPAGGSAESSARAASAPVATAPAQAAPAAPATAAAPAGHDRWFLKTEDQTQYGPVPKTELDSWIAEGRVTARCQVLREGDPQWQWASDVYPQLAGHEAATEKEEPQAAADNPFDFAAADTSPTARYGGRRRRRNRASGAHTTAPTRAASSAGQIAVDPHAGRELKSKLVAGLLGIFLGAWGVHRFYLGYTGMGVIQIFVTLCTCVGMWWGVIEGIMILTGSFNRDAMGRPLRD